MAGSPLKRWLLDFASRRKMAEFKSGVVRQDSMWDKFIFKKIQVSIPEVLLQPAMSEMC